MRQYQALFKHVSELSSAESQAMAALYLAHYDGSNETLFFDDLVEKTEALLVFHAGKLAGFSTLQIYDRNWNENPIRVVYSGDTIVAREHWGQQALAFNWIERMGRIKRTAPCLPLYWFLLVKGHRTYRYLPAFGKSFYPHWSNDRHDLKPLADMLAREKFGEHYDPATGIVAFPLSRGHLKPEVAQPTIAECNKDAVRYFLKRNPDFMRGNELVCLCELAESNMKPLAQRLFAKAAR